MPTSKRAVVTGGANGIGQAFSKRLAAQGAKVVVADIADGAETVERIKKSGGTPSRALRPNVRGRRQQAPRHRGAGTWRLRHPGALRRHLSDGGDR